MYNSVKVATISLKPAPWDKAANADKMEAFFVKAANTKPQVILTTEGVLEGYVVMDVIYNPEKAEAMLEIAEPIDGPLRSALSASCQESKDLPLLRFCRTHWQRCL